MDVAVIGGGPAGLAASLWAARYQRTVLLIDAGEQRNRSAVATYGYLFADSVPPEEMLERGRRDVRRYPEVDVRLGAEVREIERADDGFDVHLAGGEVVKALRLVLATGVRDEMPAIDGFDECYGKSVFTCPSCDGYEAKGRGVVVISAGEHVASLAVGLLDWARSVTVVDDGRSDALDADPERLRRVGVEVIAGEPVAFVSTDGALEAVRLASGEVVPCEIAFCATRHVQGSDFAERLGCRISDEGCVIVDDHCETSVEHVYAAGDMTPGPHLVQVAAAKGAIAGIGAAMSLRGEEGAPGTHRPAPDPEAALR